MSSVKVQLAGDTDNGIVGLAEKCPQEGMITYYINRTPRFNTLQRLLDPDAWHLVARKEESVIGLVVSFTFRPWCSTNYARWGIC
ncbi:MAG: hypothetical protein U5L72_15705 [Bacteroidales bacterium]|nr:hypothetical protein [Bacteroidales bacterium]